MTIIMCAATGIKFSIEDLEVGRFAHVAWVHSAMLDFRAMSDERAELYNRVGDPFVAIHLWSADSEVGQRVVLPFVEEFEPKLLGPSAQNSSVSSTSSSGRSAFDPRHQEEAKQDADMSQLLGHEAVTGTARELHVEAPFEPKSTMPNAQANLASHHTRRPARRAVSDTGP